MAITGNQISSFSSLAKPLDLAVPGLGSAISGVGQGVGAVKNFFDARAEERKFEREMESIKRQNMLTLSQSVLDQFPTDGVDYGNYLAKGGTIRKKKKKYPNGGLAKGGRITMHKRGK